jgi:hypothetical protein
LFEQVVVRGGGENSNASSRILTNVTVNAATPSLLLTNLTAGVTYSVTASAATRAGPGPPSAPATLRLNPAARHMLKDQHDRYFYLLLIYLFIYLCTYLFMEEINHGIIGGIALLFAWQENLEKLQLE